MDIREKFGAEFTKEWQRFVKQNDLDKKQEEQFARYLVLLLEENERVNLTAITNPRDVISYHFHDSLQLKHAIDMSNLKTICDVGTGGGFPGLPLKILFPHLHLVLIEVNQKKVRFLERVVADLGIESVEICSLDWRTFLRKVDDTIDLFCARASLQPEDLLRMFKPSSPYKGAQLVYWAARSWSPDEQVRQFLHKEHEYKVKSKQRKLVFFKMST